MIRKQWKMLKRLLGDKIEFVTDHYDALKDADALVIATEWSVFRTPDFEKVIKNMKAKVIFDGRNLYDLKADGETWILLQQYWKKINKRIN